MGWIMPAIAAGSAIYGMISGNKARREAQEKQVEDQRKMNEHQSELQYEMWKKTNHKANTEELKKAGLNTALIYGQTGAGGATTGSVGAGTASKADVQSFSAQDAMQMGLMGAQKKLLEAQATKAEAEADKTAGVDTKQQEAQTLNTIADTAIKQIRGYVEGETQADTIFKIGKEAQKAMHDANIAYQEQYVKEETAESTKLKIESEAIGAMIEAQAKKQGIKLSEAQIDKINADISQGWEKLRLEARGQDISVKNMEELTETMLWQAGINATGNLVNNIIDLKKAGKGKK